ncbi:MAG: DMT family transporter [Fibrobacterota bacterium]
MYTVANAAALSGAFLWALGAVLFRKTGASLPVSVQNLLRHSVAAIIFLAIHGTLSTAKLPISAATIHLFILSSFLGIALSETLFFQALKDIGTGKTALIGTLYTPVTLILSFCFLNEQLTATWYAGGLLILSGIFLIRPGAQSIKSPHHLRGTAAAMVSVISGAAGTVLIKPLVDSGPLIPVITLRLLIALPMLWTAARFSGGCVLSYLSPLYGKTGRRYLFAGTLLADVAAALLWMYAIQRGSVSAATILSQTSTLFALILAVIILGEPLTHRRIAALALTASGAVLSIL